MVLMQLPLPGTLLARALVRALAERTELLLVEASAEQVVFAAGAAEQSARKGRSQRDLWRQRSCRAGTVPALR